MADHLGGVADGQTPLDPDEAAALLRPAVTTRGELDIVEQENITRGIRWAFGRRRRPARCSLSRFCGNCIGECSGTSGDGQARTGRRLATSVSTRGRSSKRSGNCSETLATGSSTRRSNAASCACGFITAWSQRIRSRTETVATRDLLPTFSQRAWTQPVRVGTRTPARREGNA